MKTPLALVATTVLLSGCAMMGGGRKPPNERAELPHWPYGVDLPESVNRRPSGNPVLAWAPEGAERIRAVLIIVNNAASKHFGEHPALREVAARRELGVVYLRSSGPESAIWADPKTTMLKDIMRVVADTTGIREFRHAPWITFGQSSRGRFPFSVAWAFPERTVATISHHAETPTWPPEPWAKVGEETVLHVSMNGETEWGGTWHRHVRPSLLNYREHTAWLPHQAAAYDVGHQNEEDLSGGGGPDYETKFPGIVTIGKMWDYLAVYVDKALALRLPEEGYPTRRPFKLRNIDPDSGYLIDPFAVEACFELPPFPLRRKGTNYVVAPSMEKPQTFVAIPPAKDYQPPEGVPVVPLNVGKYPANWLLTGPLPFAMKNDPMRSLGAMKSLRPKPDDKIEIDGTETVFKQAGTGTISGDGRINLAGIFRSPKLTLLAFTVLDIPEKTTVTMNVPFTASGRVQAALNGIPVDHRQIVELSEGLYPMLVAARLRTKWGDLKAGFKPAEEKEIAAAKERTKKLAADAADAGEPEVVNLSPAEMIRKATEVPGSERKHMLWIADKEQADAWIKMHSIHKTQE